MLRMSIFVQGYCAECGEVPIPHRMEIISQTADMYLRKFFLTRFLFNTIEPLLFSAGRGVPLGVWESLLNTMAKMRMVRTYASVQPFHDTRMQALYEGAVATGVTLTQYAIGTNHLCFIAKKEIAGTVESILFRIIPRPHGHASPSLAWMDDKGILKQKMKAADFPHADGGAARTRSEALAIFRRLGVAVIVKPHQGSRGRHTTLDVRTEDELLKAFDIAREISTHAVIERYLHGSVHRVTLVGKKPVAIARREYPHVIGDGVHTVDELIDIENAKPLRHSTHFRPLDKEYRVAEALKKQNLTHGSVPKFGAMVIISDKNSRFHGTITEDVTDTVHPDNIVLFERFGAFLGDPIVGVDFMIEDMARSWKEQPDAGVIECNAMPFIDVHHQVASGRTINVAAHLWDVVLNNSSK